jgi:thymidine phosphorylase
MPAAAFAQDTIRRKRAGDALPAEEIRAFVAGIANRSVSDAQMAAFAMAVCLRGMQRDECVALTLAMRDSGRCLDWSALPGAVVDKHSSGGVGDPVSLLLGPMLAACGCFVPMISGRGLGHTGGTLDKLEAIPGYCVTPTLARLRRVVRDAGVAIVGAGRDLAPADRRLYAVRDVTATTDSVPLLTSSILSKKLASGLQSLVLDVKVGSGAFLPAIVHARELAESLVQVGCGAGLPTRALITDMDEPLAPCAGNAIELRLALDCLSGRTRPTRLHEVVMALGGALLEQAGVAMDEADARRRLQGALDSGCAAERFARMAAGLGGPGDIVEHADRHLARASVQRVVAPPFTPSRVAAIDTRALGLAVVRLGGGRQRAGDRIDPGVGLCDIAPRGALLERGTPLAIVHASSEAAADAGVAAVRAAFTCVEPDQPVPARPLIVERVERKEK